MVAQEGYAAADRFFLTLNPAQPLPLPWDYPRAPTDLKAAKRRSGRGQARP